MDPIAEIRERFRRYPDARTQEGKGWIKYLPPKADGFSVEFRVEDGSYLVAFEGWHERFDYVEEALNCFAFGLSDACRLKVISRGGAPHKWILETLTDGVWVMESETGLLLFRFWGGRTITYRQNGLIKSMEKG